MESSFAPNAAQQAIIQHLTGALLVIAPVGTGKTHVLALRVANALQHGIPPQKILAVTFTNRAAQELRDRVVTLCPGKSRELTVRTFHALCAHLLRMEARHIGLPVDFVIYDEADCVEIIKDLVRDLPGHNATRLYHAIQQQKTAVATDHLSMAYDPTIGGAPFDPHHMATAVAYQRMLRERHALDFADLILSTRAMLHTHPEIQHRWAERYAFIQVDEAQDTHRSEYEVISCLARQSRCLALIGDMDQTIYEWRGSEPVRVIDTFKAEYDPTVLSLVENYRATRTLLHAASSFANSFDHRHTIGVPASTCQTGERIHTFVAPDEPHEGAWIAEAIHHLATQPDPVSFSQMAVLTRTHARSQAIAEALGRYQIPCVTAEEFEFFRRQEIKDALAFLHLLLNPCDAGALRRILLRTARGIGSATVTHLVTDGAACGVRLPDLLTPVTRATGDPFGQLLHASSHGAIVVLDVETTGLDCLYDEVIEVAAIRLRHGKQEAQFHAVVQNTIPVGHTESIHGWSDAYLQSHGRPAPIVFREFVDFLEDAVCVGHNIAFDRRMLLAHARRAGVMPPTVDWYDTWDLATRYLIDVPNYKLATLAQALRFSSKPIHQAMDDVHTTVDLLYALIPMMAHSTETRRHLIARYATLFTLVAHQFDAWRLAAHTSRPDELLARILEESGLAESYRTREEPARRTHLAQLQRWVTAHDDPTVHPEDALRAILDDAALARHIDHLAHTDNRVLIMTVHQAKGLEFDTVFLAGAVEGEFPHYNSVQEGRIEEERRLFYVGLTRPKRRLYLSAYRQNARGYQKPVSRFIGQIDQQYCERTE